LYGTSLSLGAFISHVSSFPCHYPANTSTWPWMVEPSIEWMLPFRLQVSNELERVQGILVFGDPSGVFNSVTYCALSPEYKRLAKLACHILKAWLSWTCRILGTGAPLDWPVLNIR
jgi:hypothetical protein